MIIIFTSLGGERMAIKASTIEAIIEHDRGCTIVTSNDTHRSECPFDEALDRWETAREDDEEPPVEPDAGKMLELYMGRKP